MTTPYKGQSTFWSTIASFLTGDWADEKALAESINRLRDGSVWLRDEITRLRAALAKPSAGSPAVIIGVKDLSEVVYDEIAGDLNGKDLQIQSDTSGVKTITFGIGKGAAPLGPGDVVTQILTQTANDPSALVDAAGHLNLMSMTASALGTITAIGGSALPLLGFAVGQTSTGQSSGAAGVSLIGVPAMPGPQLSFGGGTLEAALLTLFGGAAALWIDKWEVVPWVAPPGIMTIDGTKPAYLLSPPTASGVVILKNKYLPSELPRLGTVIRVKRPLAGALNAGYLLRNESSGNNVCGMPAQASTAADLRWNGTRWTLAMPGNGVSGLTDADD